MDLTVIKFLPNETFHPDGNSRMFNANLFEIIKIMLNAGVVAPFHYNFYRIAIASSVECRQGYLSKRSCA